MEQDRQTLLAFAKSLTAAGRHEEAVAAIRYAHDKLISRLATIKSTAIRTSCFTHIPEHREVLELAAEWAGLPGPS